MKSALLVIDMQRGLFEPAAPFEADAVVARINALAERARRAGVPVLFVQHETRSGAMQAGGIGVELLPALRVQDGDVRIRKTTPDSFLGTTLQAHLQAAAVGHLVICGYASEFCVDTTVRRAAALGHAVTLAADAHTTHDKPHASAAAIRAHENATLPEIGSFGVRIMAMPSDDIRFA